MFQVLGVVTIVVLSLIGLLVVVQALFEFIEMED